MQPQASLSQPIGTPSIPDDRSKVPTDVLTSQPLTIDVDDNCICNFEPALTLAGATIKAMLPDDGMNGNALIGPNVLVVGILHWPAPFG